MEPGLVKGHFFMGQALVELGRYDDAIVCLKAGMQESCLCVLIDTKNDPKEQFS